MKKYVFILNFVVEETEPKTKQCVKMYSNSFRLNQYGAFPLPFKNSSHFINYDVIKNNFSSSSLSYMFLGKNGEEW